jgi:hypothetical protein
VDLTYLLSGKWIGISQSGCVSFSISSSLLSPSPHSDHFGTRPVILIIFTPCGQFPLPLEQDGGWAPQPIWSRGTFRRFSPAVVVAVPSIGFHRRQLGLVRTVILCRPPNRLSYSGNKSCSHQLVSGTLGFMLNAGNFIHSFSSLSYDSSKASSPHSAIQSLLLQIRVSSPFLKVIQ